MGDTQSPMRLISTIDDLKEFLEALDSSQKLYLALHGLFLGRGGTLTIIIVLTCPRRVLYLIDVVALGEATFLTATDEGKSLKSILEDYAVRKYFFDVRRDAAALWMYGIGLNGVTDIQLLENASRVTDKTYCWSLKDCVQTEHLQGPIARFEQRFYLVTNHDPSAMFEHPPKSEVVEYWQQIIKSLPGLRNTYTKRISVELLKSVRIESALRVQEAKVHQGRICPNLPKGPWT